MKRSHRYITSLFMTAIYLLIVFTPLAPCAMQSKRIAHAVTGECSGDCRVDGCSVERSAAHTCCCWQKKQHDADDHHSTSDVCDTHPSASTTVAHNGASCCEAHVDHEDGSVSRPATQKQRTTTISSSPCGSGKLSALLNVEAAQHLPFFFTGEIPSPGQSTLIVTPPDRLTSRYGDPPDPPPIIS